MMVNENNEPTFLYRVTDGLHLKSWGSHCAKLAGIPETIISRSEQISTLMDQKKFIPPLPLNESSEITTTEEDGLIEIFLESNLERPECLSELFSAQG